MTKPGGGTSSFTFTSSNLRQLADNYGEMDKGFAKRAFPIGSKIHIELVAPDNPSDIRHGTYEITGYQRGKQGGVIPRVNLIGKLEYGSSQINNMDKLAYWTDMMHSAYKYSLNMKVTKS